MPFPDSRIMTQHRIAVVSPFIDKRHGTERPMVECLSRLAADYEFHIYSNRVEDVDLDRIVWHRIPLSPALICSHIFGGSLRNVSGAGAIAASAD